MPKSTKKFNSKKITEHLTVWQKAADNLEKTGKGAYRAIRKYIPKHEAQMSNAQKNELVDQISMLGAFENTN